jgi:transcriptional regulator with XRE-family HTH domain
MTNIPRNKLAQLRKRSRLTQQEVSILTGYDVTTISKHECGTRGLDHDAVLKYARLYKVETYEIFELGEGEGDEDGAN